MNAHIHPLMAEILNSHARLPTQFAPPSVVAEMQGIAHGIFARAAKHVDAPVTHVFRVAPSRAALLAELAIEKQGFDSAYHWTEDYSVYCFQDAKHQRIKALEVLLSGVAE